MNGKLIAEQLITGDVPWTQRAEVRLLVLHALKERPSPSKRNAL